VLLPSQMLNLVCSPYFNIALVREVSRVFYEDGSQHHLFRCCEKISICQDEASVWDRAANYSEYAISYRMLNNSFLGAILVSPIPC